MRFVRKWGWLFNGVKPKVDMSAQGACQSPPQRSHAQEVVQVVKSREHEA